MRIFLSDFFLSAQGFVDTNKDVVEATQIAFPLRSEDGFFAVFVLFFSTMR